MKPIKNKSLIILFALVFFLFVRDHVSAREGQEDNASSTDILKIEDNQVEIPLESVLLLALKNNLDITFASLQPEIAATDVTREKSAYDTLFSSQYSK